MFIIFHRFCLKQPILFIAFLTAHAFLFSTPRSNISVLMLFYQVSFSLFLEGEEIADLRSLWSISCLDIASNLTRHPGFRPIYFLIYFRIQFIFLLIVIENTYSLFWPGLGLKPLVILLPSLFFFFYYFSVILVFILSEEPGNKNPSPLNVFPFLILPPLSFILSKIWSVASKIGWIKPGQPAVMKRKILKEQVNGYVLNIRCDSVVMGCILFSCITSLCGHKNF